MEIILVGIIDGFDYVTSLSGLSALFLGIGIGFTLGVIPGLGGGTALILTLPLVFFMPPKTAFIVFAAEIASAAAGGAVTSIVLNTPGTIGNLTTVLDGYPMARKGLAGRALGIAGMSSLIGGLIGFVIIIMLIPIVRTLIYLYGAQEFFWTVILALLIVAMATPGNFLKGLVSGLIGLLLSFVGVCLLTGSTRYTGGLMFLWDGFYISPLVLGLFAVSELLTLQSRGTTIAQSGLRPAGIRDVFGGVRHAILSWVVALRGSIIGTIVGIIPGIGGVVAQYISYGTTKMLAKDRSMFGQGNPDGVVASEVANNAKDSGAFLPTLFFGIPGSPEFAILLGIFIIAGLAPGPAMAMEHMDILWAIIIAAIGANVISCLAVMTGASVLSRITSISINLVVGITVPLCLASVYVARTNPWDCVALTMFAILGILMKRTGYSMGPLVIAWVLGPLAEKSFYTSLASGYYNPLILFHSPLSIALASTVLLAFLIPISITVRHLVSERQKDTLSKDKGKSNGRSTARRGESIIMTTIFFITALLFTGFAPSQGFRGGLWPFVVGVVAIVVIGTVLISDVHSGFSIMIRVAFAPFSGKEEPRKEVGWTRLGPILGWFLLFVGITLVAGSMVATLISVFALARFWGHMSWQKSAILALATALVIYGVYYRAFDTPLWTGFIPEIIPNFIGGGILPSL